jgi:transposase
MTKRTHRNHSPDKAKAAIAAMKGDRTIAQLSDQFGVHVSQITAWKEQLPEGAANVFGPGAGGSRECH